VEPAGFEPATSARNQIYSLAGSAIFPTTPKVGADGGSRTRDLKLGKLVFCQLNYIRIFSSSYPSFYFEAAGRHRTGDLSGTNQVLYQLSYSSTKIGKGGRIRTDNKRGWSPLLYQLELLPYTFFPPETTKAGNHFWFPGLLDSWNLRVV
jgi:hypothetical protein